MEINKRPFDEATLRRIEEDEDATWWDIVAAIVCVAGIALAGYVISGI